MGKSFVYNTGSYEDDKKDNELRLTYGIFIDGTLNNKTNTKMRRKYRKEDEHSIINKGSKKDAYDLKKEKEDYERLENNDFKLAGEGTPERQYQEYLIGIHRSTIDKQGTDNSYSNDDTNVTRMWDCCKPEYAIYIEGMGTGDLQYDSADGFAFGSGLTGIRNRVRTSCQRIVEKIKIEKKKNSKSKITEITLDVFGFSRGAASARNFAYEVSKSEYNVKEIEIPYLESVYVKPNTSHDEFGVATTIDGYYSTKKRIRKSFGDADGLEIDKSLLVDGKMPRMGHFGYIMLKDTDITPQELKKIQIIIRFIGLYDTVSSYYEVGALGSYKDDGTVEDDGKFGKLAKEAWSTHFKNDEEELNLHLNPRSFQKMIHFTAKDEHRRNFSLTRINQIVDKAIERNYPGVHCDIGGAYENGIEVVDEIGTNISDHDFKKEFGWGNVSPIIPVFVPLGLISLKQDLIEKSWYKEAELEINTDWKGLWGVNVIPTYKKLKGTRFVNKEYSWILLHFMEEFARQTQMKLFFKDKSAEKYPISEDSFLGRIEKHLHHYTFTGGKEWEFKSDEELERKKKIREEKEAKEKEEKEKEERERLEFTDGFGGGGFSAGGAGGSYAEESKPKTVEFPKEKELKPILLEEVVVTGYNSQKMIRQLRHEYLHWSSNRDWFGMEPNDDRKRKYFYP